MLASLQGNTPADSPALVDVIREPAVIRTLVQMLHLFSTGIALSLVIAIITLATMQILQPVVRGIAQFVQLYMRRRSARTLLDEPYLPELPIWLYDAVGGAYQRLRDIDKKDLYLTVFPAPGPLNLLRSVSNGLLMKRVQDAADQLLARPSLNVLDFRWLTRKAPPVDANTILLLDMLSLEEPALVAHLLGTEDDDRPRKGPEAVRQPKRAWTGRAEAVAAAQQSVSTAAERELDELQLKLDGTLATTTRVACIAIGVAVVWTAADALQVGDRWAVGMVGIIGGLLGALFHDMMSSAFRKRR
ncbi:hypothetical protein QH494_26105 [Sphingomonas sp. AR_OL41]|uniref:hypothetical protein n=1 Tax=Sphingomonas sp. AR_OL41 TaxID=3042729 RepID=UPI0024805866|nr:hypothetical protein [Sphingomonas sp. AR_OL41]MDH7975674.1 hypothetical protein [Sphingomonas sp. AR_OL41]